MSTEVTTPQEAKIIRTGGGDSVYSLGMIGAWVYYFQRATTNEERVKAFLKGFAWPAFLVYDLIKFLHKDDPVVMAPVEDDLPAEDPLAEDA